MALSTLVSTLKFGADTSALKSADREFKSFASTVKNVGGAIVGIMAGRAVMGSISGAADSINRLTKEATALGTTTASIQELEFVANKSNISVKSMAVGMKELSLRAQQAANGNKDLAKMFSDFDIQLKNSDGSMKSQTDLMLDMAKTVKSAQKEGKEMIVMQKLMGKGAKELSPIFKQSEEALRGQVQRFRELGGPASQRVIDSSERFHERQLELKIGVDNLKQSMLVLFMDTIGEKGVEKFASLASKVAEFTDNLDAGDTRAIKLSVSLGSSALAAGQLAKVLGGTTSAIMLAATAGYLLGGYIDGEFKNALSGGRSKLFDFAVQMGLTEKEAISLFVKLQRLGTSFSDTFGAVMVGTFRLAVNEVLSIIGGLAEGFGKVASFLTGGKIGGDVAQFGQKMREEAVDAQKDAVKRIKDSGDRAVDRRRNDDRNIAFSTEARRLGEMVTNPNTSDDMAKQASARLAHMNKNPGQYGGGSGASVTINQNLNLSSTASIEEQMRKIEEKNRELQQSLETSAVLASESI